MTTSTFCSKRKIPFLPYIYSGKNTLSGTVSFYFPEIWHHLSPSKHDIIEFSTRAAVYIYCSEQIFMAHHSIATLSHYPNYCSEQIFISHHSIATLSHYPNYSTVHIVLILIIFEVPL
jgi:hypothetical protein